MRLDLQPERGLGNRLVAEGASFFTFQLNGWRKKWLPSPGIVTETVFRLSTNEGWFVLCR